MIRASRTIGRRAGALIGLSTLLATLIGIAPPAAAQDVTVEASVNETTIGSEEALTYSITVQGSDGSNIRTPNPPPTEGLSLLQSIPGTSRNVSIINGRVSQSISFNWTYRPVREGEARLGSTSVTVGNRTFDTERITVRIVPQSQRPARTPRRDPFGSLFAQPQQAEPPVQPDDRDIFIRAVPSRRTAYRNQQVTVQYRLFFRDGIQLRQSRLTDSWDAEGFWREELDVDTRPVPQVVIENGLRYNTIVLKRAALFPTRTGELSVDPLRIETEAMVPSSRDPFQSFFALRSRFTPVELSSDPIEIETLPLPDGAPESFNGAVGTLGMTARLSRSDVEVGESVELTVRISGTGNIATLDAPPIRLPASFEKYDPRIETTIERSGASLTGVKTFTWIIIPRANGTYELPPVEFSWFDPGREEYRAIRSEPFTVSVTGSADVPASIVATTNGLPVDDFAPAFRTASEWTRTAGKPLHRRWWVYVLLFLPVAVLGAVLFRERHRSRLTTDISWARGRRAHPLSRKHLRRAAELMEEGRTAAFFEELDRAVLGFIGNRLNVAERGFTRAGLRSLLAGRGVPAEVLDRLLRLLDHCDRGRYAPASETPDDLDRALDEASDLIPVLDDQLAGEK